MSTPQDQREPLTDTSDATAKQREALASPGEALSAMMDGECDDLEVRRTAARLLDDIDMQATWRRYHLVGALLRGELGAAGEVSAGGHARAEVAHADVARADVAAAERLRAAIAREPVRTATAADPGVDAREGEALPAHRPAPLAAPAAAVAVAALPRATPARRHWYTAGVGFATAAGLAGGLWIGSLVSPPGVGTPAPVAVASIDTAADAVTSNPSAAPLASSVMPGTEPGVQPVATGFDARQRARMYMLMHARQAGLSGDAQGTALIKFVSHEQR